MLLLIIFAFLAGIVTVLSPCILPVLPIILSAGIGSNKSRPYGIVLGFILSFTFFTLALTTLVRFSGISADLLRTLSVIIILIFGSSLLIPKVQVILESLFSKLANFTPQQNLNSSFWGGILLGLSLGLIWTPCVGPIIAAVITLAATSSVNLGAVLITLAYSAGTAIPMFFIIVGGRELLQRVPWLTNNTPLIQKLFGVLMILTATAIFFNFDRQFQTFILEKFPQYGTGLTSLEDNSLVQKELEQMKDNQSVADKAPELIAGGQWFNSQPLKIADLKNKVVLVDFWTYTCINCIRTLPYLKSWQQKYADKGLVIIGVHTPEFEFEKNPQNLQQAIKDFDLKYPIMQDNDYATWNAYSNHYWPAKYLIDKNGQIRYTHFGEGKYDETEKMIQELLTEAGSEVGNMPIQNPTYQVEAETPETYLGSKRMESLVSPEQVIPGQLVNFTTPRIIKQDHFAFSGGWIVGEERSNPEMSSTLSLNFAAKEVFLVMSPKKGTSRVKVFLDEKLVDQNIAGEDVKAGIVTVESDRLYKLIKLPKAAVHTLKLEFLDNNLELYAFTFG